MPFSTDSLTKARESGYSDDEIVSFVSTSDPRIKSAVESGYKLEEIASFLDSRPAPEPTPVEPTQSSGNLSSQFLSSAASGGLDAVTMAVRAMKHTPLGKTADWIVEKTGVGVPLSETIMELEGASARASEDYGVDSKLQDRFSSKLASGAGSLVPIVASGGTLAPFTGAAMAGEQGRREAEEAGVPEDAQFYAGAANAATAFITEKLLGLPALLKSARKLKVPDATFKEMIQTVAKQVGLGAAREGVQEGLESVANDLVATALYDFSRGVDWKKAATSAGIGSILGGGLGGVIQTAESLSDPVRARESAGQIDQTLAEIATTQPPIAEPTAEQVSTETPVETTTPVQFEFVGTAINTPQGIVTGTEQGTAHPNMIMEALDKGLDETQTEQNPGFAFRGSDGSVQWVDRVEAGRILTESGQLVGLEPGTPLTSEHIRNEVEGVTFNPNPNAVQVETPRTILRNVPEQPVQGEGQVPTPEGPVGVPPGTESETQVTPDQAADMVNAYRESGIAMAKRLGAPDLIAEDIFQTVLSDLTSKLVSGELTPNKIAGLVAKGVKFATSKAIAPTQKGGEAITESGDVPTATGETLISKASTERGPRAALVSEEDAQEILNAVDKLPETQAKVIRDMIDFEESTDQERAMRLGMTEAAVGQAKMRGKIALRKFVEQKGIGARLGPGAANIEEVLVSYELRKFAKRLQESKELEPELKAAIGDRYYEPIPNQVSAQRATELIETRGEENVEEEIRDETNDLSFTDRVTVGQILIKRYNQKYKELKTSNPEEANRVLDKSSNLAEWSQDYGTRLGQGVNAFGMWDRLSPEGKLRSYAKMVRKVQKRHKQQNQGEIEEIKGKLNEATKESASKASTGQQTKAKLATAKRVTSVDKPIWDQYKEDLEKRMQSLLPGDVPVKEKGPLERFTDQVFKLFSGKVSEPTEPTAKAPNIVRVRQMISEWDKLKEAWREAWGNLRNTNVVEHRLYIDKVSNYLDAPFTEGDIRSVMSEMPIFSPSRLGQLSEGMARSSAKELADVLLDEQPNVPKDVRGKIEQYALKIIESERTKFREAKSKAEAARQEKGELRSKTLDRDVWVQYQQQAIKNLESALLGSKPSETPALQEFTNRLTAALREKIPSKETSKLTPEQKKAEDIRIIRESLTNREKYEQVWTNTANALKLKYGNRPDVLQKIDEVFAAGLKSPLSQKTIQSLIRERIKADEIKLSELVKRHYSTTERIGEDLGQKIADEMGLDPADASAVAKAVESQFAIEALRIKARALAGLVKTNQVAKKVGKTGAQKLIEASNLGALTDQTFYEAVSERLGLPAFDAKTSREIMKLAMDVEAAPEGMPRMEATLKLNKFIAQQKGFLPSDLLFGIYYGNILSGGWTQAINLLDTSLNVLNEVNTLAIQNPKAAAEIYSALAKGLERGRFDSLMALTKGRRISDGKFVEDPFLMEVAEFGKKGGVPIRTDTLAGRLAKRAGESDAAYYLRLYKYIGRAMAASDALAFRGAQEAKAAQLAFKIANDMDSSVDEVLGYSRLPQYRVQAEAEGYTGSAKEARATELMIMSRPKEIQEASTDFASSSTYNVKPYGRIGALSNSVESMARKLPALKLVVPFTRIVGNVVNRGLNNSPYGYVRALRGQAGSTRDPQSHKVFTPEERNAMMVRAHVSTTVMAGLLTLHALGLITIHGQGPSEPDKKKQLRQTGWKPYSIQVGDQYFSYTYLPWGLMTAAMGNWLDSEKYNDFSKQDNLDRFAYAVQSVSSTIFNQSFLSGISTVFDAVASRSPGQQMSAGKRFVGSTVSAIGVPFTSALKDIESIAMDPKVPRAITLKEAIVASIPFASQALKPSLNALGEPIESSRNRLWSQKNTDPVWKMVADKDLRVPVPNVFFDDPDTQYKYVKESGQRLRKWMEDNLVNLSTMDRERAQNLIEGFSDGVRENVRNALIREGARKKRPTSAGAGR